MFNMQTSKYGLNCNPPIKGRNTRVNSSHSDKASLSNPLVMTSPVIGNPAFHMIFWSLPFWRGLGSLRGKKRADLNTQLTTHDVLNLCEPTEQAVLNNISWRQKAISTNESTNLYNPFFKVQFFCYATWNLFLIVVAMLSPCSPTHPPKKPVPIPSCYAYTFIRVLLC